MPIVPINEPVGMSQSLTLLVYRVEGLSIVANHSSIRSGATCTLAIRTIILTPPAHE
jgi:hypothetical protein